MDIKHGQLPVPLPQDKFHKLDYQVMGQAFGLHTEMGNLWDEKEYQSELALRCRTLGLDAVEEVPITVSHNGFSKTYFIDILVNGSIYELKTTSAISDHHEAQTLNYLFLSNTQHGKIINFKPDSLTWRFISTTLHHECRMTYSTETIDWKPATEQGQSVFAITEDLLSKWGAYLSINLYKEALCHFLATPLENEHKRFISLSDESILHISGLEKRKNNLRHNLQKYLTCSHFSELLWINFNQNNIEFCSLNNSASK
ncbi:MAG: GxxExxY protein [Pontiella sp.]|nr:GxxExxY protein [Pontiella sp.]